MNFDEFMSSEQDLTACSTCGSHNIYVNDEEDLVCQECGRHFSILESADGLMITAMLLHDQAQKELAGNPQEYLHARSDLQKTRRLLERGLKKDKDTELLFQLAMVYVSLGDTYLINFEERESAMALEAFRKALRYVKQCRRGKEMEGNEEQKESILQTWFFQGMIHDKMAVALNDFRQKESVITQLKKSVLCFENYLKGEQELISENNQAISVKYMMRNLWMLIQTLSEKKDADQALETGEKLLDLLESIEPQDEEMHSIIQTGLVLTHQQMANILETMPAKKRSGKSGPNLKNRQIQNHLKESQRIAQSLEEDEDINELQAEFLMWLGLLPPQSKEDYLRKAKAIHDFDDGEFESVIDWDSMSRKEQKQTARALDQKYDRIIQELVSQVHSKEDAQGLAQRLIDLMEEMHNQEKPVLDAAQMCFYLYQAGHAFEKKDYQAAAFDLFAESVQYGAEAKKQDLSVKQKADLENFLALVCFKAYTLGRALHKDRLLYLLFFSMSESLLEDLEKDHQLYNPELYGSLLLEKARMIEADGEKQKSEKVKKRALLYLHQN